MDPAKTCQHCKWFELVDFATQRYPNNVRAEGMGTCHIRSSPGPYPERRKDDWCGEFEKQKP